MAGNIVPRTDGGSNLGTADKEFNVIYAKSFGGTIASQVVTTNSPTFTGTPAAPTAAAGTDTTQIATTAFANAAASAAASSAVSTHNLASDAHSATIAAAVNTHNAATDAHSTEFAKYLPLSGGAMTGVSLRRNADNSSLSLFGGSVADAVHGAYISAFGKDHSNAGAFSLTACNGSVASTLMGKHDGTLTWAGNPVATTNKLSMPSMANYIDLAFSNYMSYTAPCDGWIFAQCSVVSVGGWIYMEAGATVGSGIYKDGRVGEHIGGSMFIPFPIAKGSNVYIEIDGVTVTSLRFVYAASAT